MTQENPTIEIDLSLVLCTYGRTNEVDNFLNSIYTQTKKPTEIIVVDQNEENVLHHILNKWSEKLPIIHKRVNFKGASRSRNFGAKQAVSKLIAFPDDDCLYPPRLIENITKLFQQKGEFETILTAKIEPSEISSCLSKPSLNYSWVTSSLDLFKAKAETSNIFARKSKLESLPYIFNEDIGPGASTPWASNEETDLLVRLLQKNVLIAKDETIRIIHHSCQGSLKKTLQYGMGRYELIRRNNLGIFIYFINLLQPIVRLILKPRLKYIPTCFMTIIGRSGLINILLSARKQNK